MREDPYLIEDSAQLLEGQNPQGVRCDCHNTFGTLLGAEPARVLQHLVGQWGQMESRLIGVAEPGARRQRQHRLGVLHANSEQLHGAGAEVASARIGDVALDRIEHRSQETAVLQPDVQVQRPGGAATHSTTRGRIADTTRLLGGIPAHLYDTQRLWSVGQGLQAERSEAFLQG